MKAEQEGNRIRITPSVRDETELRRRAWLETGPETFEELVTSLRTRGVAISPTAYERRKQALLRNR